MLWSSYGPGKYTQGAAYSETGSIYGPWIQIQEPIFTNDGGHAMIFRTFEGKELMVLHQPNRNVERARFFEFEDTGNTLNITRQFRIR